MPTLAELEQKYFPPLLPPGVPTWHDTMVVLHVDGDAYFGAIADALDALQGPGDRIYIANWWFAPAMPLRRGGSALLSDLLVDKAAAGADVRLIVAAPRFSFGSSDFSPISAGFWLGAIGGIGIGAIVRGNIRNVRSLRASTKGSATPLADRVLIDWAGRLDSRHEKTTIIYNAATDDLRAYMSGMDFQIDRMADEMHAQGRWHDAGVELRSGAAAAATANFVTRWTEVQTLPAERYQLDGVTEMFNPAVSPTPPTLPAHPTPLPTAAAVGQYLQASVRCLRSFAKVRAFNPWYTEPNMPWQTLPNTGVEEVSSVLQRAIGAATRYVYVEDQTLNPYAGPPREYQAHTILYPIVRAACARGVKVIFVVPGAGAPQSPVTANLTMSGEIRDLILDPLPATQRENFALFYVAGVTVHSKVVLVDDEFVSIGSANFWDRSMTGTESELNAGIVHEGGTNSLIADLRVRLWRGHLRVAESATVDSELRDTSRCFGIFRASWGAGITFPAPNNALVEIAP